MPTKALKVSATNILFKSKNEQFQIIENFARMLNSIQMPIQILCVSEDLKAQDWKLKIHSEEYFNFLKKKIEENKITSKEFKIIINDSCKENMDIALRAIRRSLRGCGLEDQGCEDITLREIIPDKMTVDYVKINDIYCKTLYVENWPYSCYDGWLSDIYNSEFNIDVSTFIHPVKKIEAQKYLNKKLSQNVSSSVIDDESNDIDSDQYDEKIVSALKMREELQKNQERFFFLSCYITVKAKNLAQLKKDYEAVSMIVQGLNIELNPCFLRQDDGYKCTLPRGIDYLNKKYNITTGSLKQFFPFISSNIIDKGGVLIGDNLLNSSLVFLNPFKYNSALMFVLGLVGGGKTYLMQLLCLRLLYAGVHVDIFDRTGEYQPLKELTNLPNLTIHQYKETSEYKEALRQYVIEMDENLNKLIPRFLVIDEFWQYLDDPDIVYYIKYITLTGRKKYQGICVISQMIEHLMKDDKALDILRNASIKAIMQMQPNAAKVVKEELDLTDEEVRFIVSAQYEGILFAGTRHVQFIASASKYEDALITTDPKRRASRLNWGGNNCA